MVLIKFVTRNVVIEPPGAQIIFSKGMSSAISFADKTMPSIDILRIVDVEELYTGSACLKKSFFSVNQNVFGRPTQNKITYRHR